MSRVHFSSCSDHVWLVKFSQRLEMLAKADSIFELGPQKCTSWAAMFSQNHV